MGDLSFHGAVLVCGHLLLADLEHLYKEQGDWNGSVFIHERYPHAAERFNVAMV